MGLRLRHYKPCDAECIVSWIKDEDALRKWKSRDKFGVTNSNLSSSKVDNI